jgi:hypothetical protein
MEYDLVSNVGRELGNASIAIDVAHSIKKEKLKNLDDLCLPPVYNI